MAPQIEGQTINKVKQKKRGHKINDRIMSKFSIIVHDLFHDDYRALKLGILLVGTYKYCIITFIIKLSLFCCFYIAITSKPLSLP